MNEKDEYFRRDCYTYIDGQGFTQYDRYSVERRTLAYFSLCLGWCLLLSLLLSAVMPFILMYGTKLFMPAVRFYNNQVISKKFVFYIVGTISYFIAITLPFGFMVIKNKIPRGVVVPSRSVPAMTLLSAVCVCMGTAVAGAFCAWLISQLLGQLGFAVIAPEFPLTRLDGASVFVLLVQLLVVAPLVEEFAFRGVIMGVLRRWGDGFAVMTSACLFAMFHRNMSQFPNAFLCGMVIGCAVVYTGSVWTGVIMHVVNNLLAVGLTYFQSIGNDFMMWMQLSLMFLAGIAGFAFIASSGNTIWHKRQSCLCDDESEKYRMFFSQPVQLVCMMVMLSGIIHNIKRI